MKLTLLPALHRALLLLISLTFASTTRAGTWSTTAWTGDASTYIAPGQTVWAYHFASTTTATVNGFAVLGIAGGDPAVPGSFSVSGVPVSIGFDHSNELTRAGLGGSAEMAKRFIYNGNPGSVTVESLTVGQTYTISIFGVDWSNGVRVCTFASGGDSLAVDEHMFGNERGVRVDYTFTATAATRTFTVTPVVPSDTWHFYGLALRQESAPTTVTHTLDSGTGSLRWALANAAAISGPDTVTFDASLSGASIATLTDLPVADSGGVTIDASALAAPLTITSSGPAHRLFTHTAGSLTLRRLRLENGIADATAAVAPNLGGAVRNTGSAFAAFDCTFANNQARFSGGALSLATSGTSTIEGCTFSGNTTTADNGASGAGAAVSNAGALTVRKSTFHGNSTFASATGPSAGAILNSGTLTLEHCTLTDNTSGGSGARGAIFLSNSGGVSTTITNCIVADNPGGTDVNNATGSASSLTYAGGNIVPTQSNALFTGPAPLTSAPMLGAFGANGGETETRIPLFGSPAVDSASVLAGHSTDQRGIARPFDGDGNVTATPDIGATEARFPIVSNGNDAGVGSLRQAVADAATFPGPDNIVFRAASFPSGGTVNLSASLAIPAAGDTAGVTLLTTVTGGNVDVAVNVGTFTWGEGSVWTGGGRILLGATSGTAAATVEIADANGATFLSAPITVRAGSSGVKTLRDSNTNGLLPNTFAGAITLLAPATLEEAASGKLAISGDVDFGPHTLTVEGGAAGVIDFSGRLFRGDGTGKAQMVKNGTVSLNILGSGDNTRFALTLNAGGIVLGKTSSASVHAIGSGLTAADGAALTVAAGAGVINNPGDQIADTASVTVDGTLNLFGDEALDALHGSGTVQVGFGTRVLTVGAANGSGNFGGSLQFGLALTKTGSGTQTLSGTNTATGAIVVGGGVLNVTGSLSDIGGTTVQTGATLAGAGTLASGVTLENGSFLAPGDAAAPGSVGTLSVVAGTGNPGDVSWNSSTTARFHLSATDNSSDKLALTGALQGAVRFDFQGTGVAGQTYTLATFASGNSAAYTFTYTGLPPGLVGYFTKNATSLTFTTAAFSPVVTSMADSGPGSLRQVLDDAAHIPGANTITFPPALNSATITLSKEILIDDPTGPVTIDASSLPGGLTIDAGLQDYRHFFVASGSTVALRGLTLVRGGGPNSGGGGAIFNRGALTLERCTLSGNSAGSNFGGAISHVEGTLTLLRCTLSTNSSTFGGGGAISSLAPMTLTQCTLSGNFAPTGGAINTSAPCTLTHCTIAGNSPLLNSGGLGGGGLYVSPTGSLVLENSIVAGNSIVPTGLGPDIRNNGGIVTIQGANIVQTPIANTGTINGSGTAANVDPRLAPLADNGGPTQTMGLRAGSPALDAAPIVGGLTSDQRGFPRNRDGDAIAGAAPDIGAYEAQVAPVSGVGFNFVGGGVGGPGGTLAAADVAGAPDFAQANWNNLSSPIDGTAHDGTFSGNGPALIVNASGMTMSPNPRLWWAADHLWNISNGAPGTANGRLMNGYLDSNNGGSGRAAANLYASAASQPFFAVAGLPGTPGGYKVVVYTDGDANDRVGEYWLTTHRNANPASVTSETDLTPHLFARDGANFSGTYTRVPSTSTSDLGLSSPPGNYIVFEGLTESGFIVRSEEAYVSAPLNAVQIVANEIVVVTTAADEFDANGIPGTGLSLREALRDAPDGAGILFDSSLNGATVTLDPAKGEIVLAKSVTIDASNLASGVTIDGGTGTNRIFTLSGTGKTATLLGITLTGGNGRGALEDNAGGAILVHNGAWLNATRCTFASNSAQSGGAIYNSFSTVKLDRCSLISNGALGGGAVVTFGSVSAIDSTFSGNTSSNDGGAISNYDGTLAFTRCTFNGNTANGDGGAIKNFGLLRLTHCTVAGNSGSSAVGGGAINHGRNFMTIENSIIAGNTLSGIGSGADIYFTYVSNFSTLTRVGANIVQSMASSGGDPFGPAHIIANPQLAALASNGGPTQTMALLAGSPARNAAIGSTATSDQRGSPIVGVPDIGAFEASDASTTSYSAWSMEVAGSVLPAADDTEGDGSINALEYALRRNPLALDTELNPTVTGPAGGRLFSFRYQPTARDLRYIVQRNADLTNAAGWTEIYRFDLSTGVITELLSVTGDENATNQIITLTDPAAGANLFWRLRIELVP